jgi:anaerobic selenocysteine-containing dehydrogenase
MLLEGEGQIHALICMGGNPMTAWPDQIKTRKALEGLDLLVVGDPKLTQTAQLADFVIAPKLVPEIPALTYDMEVLEGLAPGWGYPQPYAAYREALIDPPAGSELFEDWEFLYLLGRELELELTVYTGTTRFEGDPKARPVPLDMHNTPTTDDLFEILTADARVPLSVVRQYEAGSDFEVPDAVVLGREPECEGFLEFGNVVMMNQLDDAAEDAFAGDGEFAFRLVSRRQANTMNSQGRDQDKLVRERPHNPAYMNPMDLDAIGVVSGAMVAITSRRSTIHAIAVASPDLRRGVISMSHSYGIDLDSLDPNAEPGAPQPYSMGGHTGALASADLDYVEQYSGIPRMSAIPVHVKSV